MGLDNRFMGHFKSRPEVEISLAYFRKYFNLNDWMLQRCAPVQEDNPYDVTSGQRRTLRHSYRNAYSCAGALLGVLPFVADIFDCESR